MRCVCQIVSQVRLVVVYCSDDLLRVISLMLDVHLLHSQSSKVMTAIVDQKNYLEELNRHLT